MNELVNYSKNYIYNDNHDKSMYNRICSQNMDKSLRRIFIVAALVLQSFVIAILGSIYSFIVDSKRSTLLGVRLPFVEKDSDLEFTLLLILQTWSGITGFCALAGIESAYNLYVDTIRITSTLIKLDLGAKIMTKSQIRFQLLLIFEKMHHSDRYHFENDICNNNEAIW